MNTLRDVIDKVPAGGIPAWAMGGAGIVPLLLALKVARGFLKFVFVVLAPALLAGAVGWHFHNQGRI